MAMNSEYRGSYGAVAPKKKTSTRKTVATPGTKVSQATIDKVKAMGMTKALKGAANASPEMREALKRLYGAKRVAAAGGSSARYSSPDAARAGATKPASSGGKYVGSRFVANTPPAKKPSASGAVYKSADAARAAATKTSGARMGANTVMAKANTGMAKRKDIPGKPSIGEQISGVLSGKGRGTKTTTASAAATNAKRMGISVAEYNRRLAAAKKNK